VSKHHRYVCVPSVCSVKHFLTCLIQSHVFGCLQMVKERNGQVGSGFLQTITPHTFYALFLTTNGKGSWSWHNFIQRVKNLPSLSKSDFSHTAFLIQFVCISEAVYCEGLDLVTLSRLMQMLHLGKFSMSER